VSGGFLGGDCQLFEFFRDCIENPLAHTPVDGMARAADAATGTKVANELFFSGRRELGRKRLR